MMTEKDKMKLYICYRGEELWQGALIICAITGGKAIDIYKEEERDFPYAMEEMEVREGIIYDDETR